MGEGQGREGQLGASASLLPSGKGETSTIDQKGLEEDVPRMARQARVDADIETIQEGGDPDLLLGS